RRELEDRGRAAARVAEARRPRDPRPNRVRAPGRENGRSAPERARRQLSDRQPVLDVVPRGVHGHALLRRPEGQMGQVIELSTVMRWAIVLPTHEEVALDSRMTP